MDTINIKSLIRLDTNHQYSVMAFNMVLQNTITQVIATPLIFYWFS